MKLAYLLNSYPMTSTTFIRREIEAIEALGTPVIRYAVRPWAEQLVDNRDIKEQQNTCYILAGNGPTLLITFLMRLLTQPASTLRGCAAAWRLRRNARDGFVRHFAYLLQGAYLARRANTDGVTHIHAHFASNAAAVAMLSKIMGGPEYSFTVHGPHDFFDAPLLSVGEKIGNARFVAAITNYCQSQLRLYAKVEDWPKIRIIPCGIFLDEFSEAPTATSQDFVCVGRLCPEKGQLALPAVMVRVAKSHPDAKVLLVGDGPDRSAIESEIATLGVEKNIELLGWRTGAEVAALMKQTRALILPTYAEGLPIVIMEALARSRPVITTYIAGIPELVDEACGWIFPAGDEDALVSAINEALEADAQKLARLGGEGRRRVTERHDQHRNAALLLSTIKEAGNESSEKVKTS